MTKEDNKKWIVFDVDDVVVSYRESLYQSFKKIGKDIHWKTWNTYKHVKIYELRDYDEFLEHMIENKVIENSVIEEGVSEVLNQLKKDGYSIGFLTARSWHPKAYEVTKNLIKKYNLPVDKIVIANFKGKKTDYINDFTGDIVGFLDDSVGHIEDFTMANIPNSYIMDRPWNQENKNLPRVKTYAEFYNVFDKKLKNKMK